METSVIIPVYNEEKSIGNCLISLAKQTVKTEILVVDDGSTDATVSKITGCVLLKQKHRGPGAARNLGASKARGDILVFVDADMEFEPDFIEKLIAPIEKGKTIGTFSKEEFLLNKDNVWARCWNLNLGRSPEKMEPRDFDKNKSVIYIFFKNILQKIEGGEVTFNENQSHIFRAILNKQFDKVGGFETNVGYTDDWSLTRKLNTLATAAPGAKYYHLNPGSLEEVWKQARWFGKNEFLTGSLIRKLYNLFRYCPAWALISMRGFNFLIFKVVYNTAVCTSVLLSFFGESKYK